MSKTWLDPPDAGWKTLERRRIPWRQRVLRNRQVVIFVLQVATAIVKLVRVIYSMFNGS